MARGIKKARARIKQRKKQYSTKKMQYKPRHKQAPTLFMDEEKHGIYLPNDDISDSHPIRTGQSKQTYRVLYQAFMSICLFIVCAILLNTSIIPSQKARDMTASVLTEEFPFAKVHQWYEETLGTPLALTPQLANQDATTELADTFPIEGEVMETFSANGNGVMISPEQETSVKAWEEGVVIFSGNDSETNQTVIIQHPDGSKTTYGLLSDVDVHLYKIVRKNDVIGTFNPSNQHDMAFFAVEKNGQYIDPAQVIPVDDFR